ncbi:hypothetical protein D3C78_1647310 [compost metagenome]
MTFARTLRQHAVADESVAGPHQHGDLAQAAAHVHDGGAHVVRGGGAAHVLQQLHDVGGTEKVHPHHVLGPPGGARDSVDVQERGV